MVGNLALAGEILGAGELVGEHRGDQILRLHARERRRHLLAAAEARQRKRTPAIQRQRVVNIGASSMAWVSTGAHGVGVQVTRTSASSKLCVVASESTMASSVAAACSSKLNVRQKRLRKRQSPGAVDPAAERRVDHQLHAAGLVEEALEHDGVLRGQAAERGVRRGEIFDQLRGRRLVDAAWLGRASAGAIRCRIGRRSRARDLAPQRDTARESSSLRPGASPSQNGIVGGWPCASSTRTMPPSTRRMR